MEPQKQSTRGKEAEFNKAIELADFIKTKLPQKRPCPNFVAWLKGECTEKEGTSKAKYNSGKA